MPPNATASPVLVAGALIVLFLGLSLLAWSWALGRLAQGHPLLPEPVPPRAPWGAGSVLAAVLLYVVVSNAISAAHFGYTGRRGLPDERPRAPAAVTTPPPWTPKDLLVMTSVVQGSLIVLLPLILRRTSGATLADLGFHTAGLGRNVFRGLIACAMVAPVCYLLMAELSKVWPGQPHPLVVMLRRELNGPALALAIISAVVLAPVFEELVFRGILLGWMAKAVESRPEKPPPTELADDLPPPAPVRLHFDSPDLTGQLRWLPNLVSSALFALLHKGQWPAPIPLFVLALVLSALARRTGSLWASITLHAAFNGLSTALLIFGLLTGEPSGAEPAVPPSTAHLAPPVESGDEDSGKLATFALGGPSNLN